MLFRSLITSIDGDQTAPGSEGSFNLNGSGFQEGASTISVGGQSVVDNSSGPATGDVYSNNTSYNGLYVTRSIDGPVRITTAGGYFEFTRPRTAPSYVKLLGITASASGGTAASNASPSANPGQNITLTGQGFTSSTLVRFTAEDDSGVTGLVTRKIGRAHV